MKQIIRYLIIYILVLQTFFVYSKSDFDPAHDHISHTMNELREISNVIDSVHQEDTQSTSSWVRTLYYGGSLVINAYKTASEIYKEKKEEREKKRREELKKQQEEALQKNRKKLKEEEEKEEEKHKKHRQLEEYVNARFWQRFVLERTNISIYDLNTNNFENNPDPFHQRLSSVGQVSQEEKNKHILDMLIENIQRGNIANTYKRRVEQDNFNMSGYNNSTSTVSHQYAFKNGKLVNTDIYKERREDLEIIKRDRQNNLMSKRHNVLSGSFPNPYWELKRFERENPQSAKRDYFTTLHQEHKLERLNNLDYTEFSQKRYYYNLSIYNDAFWKIYAKEYRKWQANLIESLRCADQYRYSDGYGYNSLQTCPISQREDVKVYYKLPPISTLVFSIRETNDQQFYKLVAHPSKLIYKEDQIEQAVVQSNLVDFYQKILAEQQRLVHEHPEKEKKILKAVMLKITIYSKAHEVIELVEDKNYLNQPVEYNLYNKPF